MFEENIFGDDTLKLVLRYGDYTVSGFERYSNLMSFDKLRALLNASERMCYFSKKDDTRHIIQIPISEEGYNGNIKLFVEWHPTNSYEIKANKENKSRFEAENISYESKYTIERRCQIIFLGIKELFNDFTAIGELYNLWGKVSQLEVAPTTLIENERQLWTKYIEAQSLICEKLQGRFNCVDKPTLTPIYNPTGEITRYKLVVPIQETTDIFPNCFTILINEYSKAFGEELKLDKDGYARLTKEEIERVDIMIQRKFGNLIGRYEKLSCPIKIMPNGVHDLITKDLESYDIYSKVDYDEEDNVLLISGKRLLQKLPKDIVNKYELKLAGCFCKYIKHDEFGHRFFDVFKKYVKYPSFEAIENVAEKLRDYAIQKKEKLEKEDYKNVIYVIGQIYHFKEVENSFNDEFWNTIKKDLYGLDISTYPNESLLFVDFTSFDSLEERISFLSCSNKFKLSKIDINKIKFKVRYYPLEAKSNLDSFEYKMEKLKNVEFSTRAKIDNQNKNIYIGSLNGRESNDKKLVFSIPFRFKDDKIKAYDILELLKNDSFKLEDVYANLIGEDSKLEWLTEAVEKLDEKRINSTEPNSKPVNSRLRDFIFDSSKAEPTYKFEVSDEELEETDEYRELVNRQLLTLNKSQRKAVLKAAYAKDLCLLQGPPGTGKTTVIAELIWQLILQNSTKKILLTSETNLAVDNALEKLMGSRNINNKLMPYLSLIKPLRFGSSIKFDEDGKKYSVERIEKWLDDEYEEEFIYENEMSSLENAENEINDEDETDDVNHNAVQQWMNMISIRARAYAEKDPRFAELTDNYCNSLDNPDGITKRYFKEKYYKYANVIGSTCSSTGSPTFAVDYARVFSSSIYAKYIEKEGYKQTINDIKRQIKIANDFESDYQDNARRFITRIMKENNIKREDDLQDLLDDPTDNIKMFLFNNDLKQLLRPRRTKRFDMLLERLGFNSEEEFNQLKNIYFDTVIMDEASKATPPDLVLPLCFGKTSIVIGDHRQLPPMLHEQGFKEALLSLNDAKATALAEDIDRDFVNTSQFARLILNPKVSSSIKSVFTEQYRMHPQINDVIKQFYINDEGGLTCGLDPSKVDNCDMSDPESRYHGFYHPGFISPDIHTLWINVDEPEQRSDSGALYNENEVVAVKRVLKYLVNSAGFNDYMRFWDKNIKSEERRNLEKEIGIISFYSQQVKHLKEIKSFAKENNIRVKLNTVDKFQGMERNIIIVSTVRSNKYKSGNTIKLNHNPGFAESPERLNVALSRARRLLIVIGNSDFFGSVKDRNNNYLYQNAIEEMKKHHEIIDYKSLTKYE